MEMKQKLHYLVIKPSRSVEVVKKLRVCFASPKVHVGDFKITPNCTLFGIIKWHAGKGASGATEKHLHLQ